MEDFRINNNYSQAPTYQYTRGEPGAGSGVIDMLPKPWHVSDQANNILYTYLLNGVHGLYKSGEHIKWTGLYGFKWLDGDLANRPYMTGTFGRSLSQGVRSVSSSAVSAIGGKAAGDAFNIGGISGLMNHLNAANANQVTPSASMKLINNIIPILTGNDRYLIANKNIASYAGKALFQVGPKALAVGGGILRATSSISWAMTVAQVGIWGAKKWYGFVSKTTSKLRELMNEAITHDVYLSPQLMNQYSSTIRSRALREINASDLNPRNNILGREARYMHG